MAMVKRSNRRSEKFIPTADGVILPMTYTDPSGDFSDFSVFIHGEKKVGKSSLSLIEEGGGLVLMLQFDPPQRSYRRIEANFAAKPWRDFMGYVKALEAAAKKPKFPYRRVVVDGVGAWYKKCQDHACEKLGVSHPSEVPYGKGWDALKTEFAKTVDRLLALPCGIWFLAHSHWKEVETRDADSKVEKLLPVLPGGCEEILNGKVDAWFAYDYVDSKRVLFVEGNERIGAGHRLNDAENGNFHFRVGGPDGEAVREIDMGSSPREAHDALVAAFKNEQEYADTEEKGGATKSKKKVRSRPA